MKNIQKYQELFFVKQLQEDQDIRNCVTLDAEGQSEQTLSGCPPSIPHVIQGSR